MNVMKKLLCFIFCLSIFISGCSSNPAGVKTLKRYPIKNLNGIIDKVRVRIDREISSDRNGSLKIVTERPAIIRLYETGNINVENAKLTYQAKVRTEDIQGRVFLEMWCNFPEKGDYFSRNLNTSLAGSNDWTLQETPFLLKEGENPENVKLNIIISGRGTVWVDDIKLVKGPFEVTKK